MKYSKNDLQKMIHKSKSQEVVLPDPLNDQKNNMKKIEDALSKDATIIILK